MPPRSLTSSKPARKHVTTACNPCRDGKVKCDGVKPVCSNCRAKQKCCGYRQADDKRKIPLRTTIGVLAKRIDQLSRYIQDRGLETPQMEEADYLTIKGVFEMVELTLDDAPSTAASDSGGLEGAPDKATLDDNTANTAAGSSQLETAHSGTPEHHSPLHSHHTGMQMFSAPVLHDSSPNVASALLELADADLRGNVSALPANDEEEEEEEDEVTNQLSCRLGKLQVTHGGQLRYFGSTSNLTLLDILVDIAPSDQKLVQQETRGALENAGLGITVDETFEKHLLQLYFTWHNPCLHAVDEEIFWRSRAQRRYDGADTTYYSRALSEAMCAVGATYESKYHPDLVTFPRSLAEFFSDRAKILLESELENPCLATIQALVILSAYEASCTRDTRGWLYSGMAMRLAFDLGLHLDMTPYVERGTIPSMNYKVRRTTFWAVYMSEQFWGYYLGRPTRSPMEGVTVPKPDWNNSHPLKWSQYGPLSLSGTMANLPNPLGLICYQWVLLYDYMLPLTDLLYGCDEISKHQLQKLTSDTVEKLRLWKANLPPELNIYEKAPFLQPLPHVLALHMQYHQLIIHCHRPYISRHHIQPQPPQGPGSSHARMMCIESAISIAKALTLYERHYSFRRANFQIVSFIFSAALILIFAIVPARVQYEHDRELVAHLSTCFRALDEMGSLFENARRTSTFLNTLQREWQTRRRSQMARGVKRSFDIFHEPWNNDPTLDSLQGGSAADSGFGSDGQPGMGSLEESSYAVDFMEPDLCNILLSEGIPRSFV